MEKKKLIIINESDKDYSDYEFLVGIGDIGTHWFKVYAHDEQEAIDIIADYCTENDFIGFFADDSETRDYYNCHSDEFQYLQDTYFPAGNESRLFTNEIHFEKIKRIKH